MSHSKVIRITRDRADDLARLPHGAKVLVSCTETLTMNREDMPEPFFECVTRGGEDVGWLRCNHVFENYGVKEVLVVVAALKGAGNE